MVRRLSQNLTDNLRKGNEERMDASACIKANAKFEFCLLSVDSHRRWVRGDRMWIDPGNTPIVFEAGGLDFLGCEMEFLSDPICKPDGVQPAEIFGLIGSDPAGVSLEIETQRNLARPISAVLRGLNALDNAKGG